MTGGMLLDPGSAGRAHATEAVAAMLRIGFEMIGLHRVFERLGLR